MILVSFNLDMSDLPVNLLAARNAEPGAGRFLRMSIQGRGRGGRGFPRVQ